MMFSHDIFDIARSLPAHWPGLVLVCLSVATMAAAFTILAALILPRRVGRVGTIRGARVCLDFVASTAPTVGLLGTIYGLLRSLLSARPEEIPQFIALALQTTYVGGILFLVCVSLKTLTDHFGSFSGRFSDSESTDGSN